MRDAMIRLTHPDGTPHRWITLGEAKRLRDKGEIVRVASSRRNRGEITYRLVEFPSASTSRNSMPTLTLADMRRMAGEQRLEVGKEEENIERLIGFGLLPMNVVYPVNGFL